MDFFLLRNTVTGWEGSVTEKIYHDRIRQAEYEDPRSATRAEPKQTIPEVDESVKTWALVDLGDNWFDVARGDEKANKKPMRKPTAAKLLNKLQDV